MTVRVFRTLLSKGLCSDETEDGEGEGEGDIDGMKASNMQFPRVCFVFLLMVLGGLGVKPRDVCTT